MNPSCASSTTLGDNAELARAESAFTSEGGRLGLSTAPAADNDSRLSEMAELGIRHVGRFYRLCGYQYERLEDAVAYARLMMSRAVPESPREPDSSEAAVAARDELPPDAATRDTMAVLGVSCVGGLYAFEDFRYERLADAMHYALQHQRR